MHYDDLVRAEIDGRDLIIADLTAQLEEAVAGITRLTNLVDHLEEESGQRDCAELEDEVERLKDELELMRGTTYCAYCSERFELDSPDMTERVTAHILICPKHPMRIPERELKAALANIELLRIRLNSGVSRFCTCGGASPGDAKACSICALYHEIINPGR